MSKFDCPCMTCTHYQVSFIRSRGDFCEKAGFYPTRPETMPKECRMYEYDERRKEVK